MTWRQWLELGEYPTVQGDNPLASPPNIVLCSTKPCHLLSELHKTHFLSTILSMIDQPILSFSLSIETLPHGQDLAQMPHLHEALHEVSPTTCDLRRSWCIVYSSAPATSCQGPSSGCLVHLSGQDYFLCISLPSALPSRILCIFWAGNKHPLHGTESIRGEESCKELFPGWLEPEVISTQHQMKQGFASCPSHWICVGIQMGKFRPPHWHVVFRIPCDTCTVFILHVAHKKMAF